MLGCMRIRQGGLRCFSKSSIVPALAGDQPHFFQGRCRSQFFWSLWSPKKTGFHWRPLQTCSYPQKKGLKFLHTRAESTLNIFEHGETRVPEITGCHQLPKVWEICSNWKRPSCPSESNGLWYKNTMSLPRPKMSQLKTVEKPFFWGNSSQKYGWTSNNHWNPQTKIGWLPIEIHMLCVCVFSTSPNWKIPSQSTNLIQPKVEVNSLTARLEDRLSHPTERWVWAGNPVIKPHDTTICKGQDL